ncbi:MAG: hypothetical protein JXL84_03685 [Deltaproteobacteria bacterium]|nr:hypothetical protein [Deltaproteobacteria bacterium]
MAGNAPDTFERQKTLLGFFSTLFLLISFALLLLALLLPFYDPLKGSPLRAFLPLAVIALALPLILLRRCILNPMMERLREATVTVLESVPRPMIMSSSGVMAWSGSPMVLRDPAPGRGPGKYLVTLQVSKHQVPTEGEQEVEAYLRPQAPVSQIVIRSSRGWFMGRLMSRNDLKAEAEKFTRLVRAVIGTISVVFVGTVVFFAWQYLSQRTVALRPLLTAFLGAAVFVPLLCFLMRLSLRKLSRFVESLDREDPHEYWDPLAP